MLDRRMYLWRKIVGGAAQRPCSIRAVFCEAKIGNFDMAVDGQEDIFGFEIAIHDVEGV